MQRTIEKKIQAQASSDGDGVRIARSIGSRQLVDIDPFLLLDELRSDDAADYIGGFPPHPHRGFETITYMLKGQMRHKDSAGNEGVIRAGDLQWMTAGSGIIHSEMPEQNEGSLWGFQFWLNLPASDKMRSPRYQEIASDKVPELQLAAPAEGIVRVLAGNIEHSGQTIVGAATDIVTQPVLLDVQLEAGQWSTALPPQHTALVYVYRGALAIAGSHMQEQQLAVLSSGDELTLLAKEGGFGALVMAAQTINEPIARSGPFVMNTEQEVAQAFDDYRRGRLVQAV